MIIVIWVGIVVAVIIAGLLLEDARRERTRKVRHRDYVSAISAVNDIDVIVGRYYLTADMVGQAMCDEIRTVITKHRKETTCR